MVAGAENPPLRAVPPRHAIAGVQGARAYVGRDLDADRSLLTQTLGFSDLGDGEYRLDGDTRHFDWGYDTSVERRLTPLANPRAGAPPRTPSTG